MGGGNDVDLVPDVIEGQQAVEKHQDRVGNPQVVFRQLGQPLQLTHSIMRQKAYSAGGKWRQARNEGGFMLLQQAVQHLENVSFQLLLFTALFNRDLLS